MNNILLGDARNLIKDLDTSSIDLIILDPPYIDESSFEWDKEDVINHAFAVECKRVLKHTGVIYCWCNVSFKSQSLIRWFPIFNQYFEFVQNLVWHKQRGHGSWRFWLRCSEYCMIFADSYRDAKINKDVFYIQGDLLPPPFKGQNGKDRETPRYRRRTDVWDDLEVLYAHPNKEYKEYSHPNITRKPETLFEKIISAHTDEGDVVLDPFVGTGSVLEAALELKRNFIGFENNPDHRDFALNRLERVKQKMDERIF